MRYSAEAIAKMRIKRYFRWLSRAKDIHAHKFNYDKTLSTFKTYKKNKVLIYCNLHQIEFEVLPDKHLNYKFGGCSRCEVEGKSTALLEKNRRKFLDWFNKSKKSKFIIVSEFQGMTKNLKIECKIHKKITDIIPTTFKNTNGHGCSECAKEAVRESSRLNIETVKNKIGKIPSNIKIEDVIFDECKKMSLIKFSCNFHGSQPPVRLSSFKRSLQKCKSCGVGGVGFASNRLRELINLSEQGHLIQVGLIEVEVYGIKALKIGVTRRKLEERYLHFVKKIFYQVQLYEIDGYVLENKIKLKFEKHRDNRILMKGMREGKRWSGDTEMFRFSEKENIINYIKNFIENLKNKKPNYIEELGKMMIPVPFPKRVGRDKGEFVVAREVVGIDPKTNQIIHTFASANEAYRNGYRNVSSIASKNTYRQTAGGLRWFWKDEFDINNIPNQKPKNIGLSVYCVERNQHFLSAMEAERKLRKLGFKVLGSHIISVLKGKRKLSGGFTWKKSDLTKEDIMNIKIKNVKPPKIS